MDIAKLNKLLTGRKRISQKLCQEVLKALKWDASPIKTKESIFKPELGIHQTEERFRLVDNQTQKDLVPGFHSYREALGFLLHQEHQIKLIFSKETGISLNPGVVGDMSPEDGMAEQVDQNFQGTPMGEAIQEEKKNQPQKIGTFSRGSVKLEFPGTAVTKKVTIPENTIFTTDFPSVSFKSGAEQVVSGYNINVSLLCQEPGSVGNISAHRIKNCLGVLKDEDGNQVRVKIIQYNPFYGGADYKPEPPPPRITRTGIPTQQNKVVPFQKPPEAQNHSNLISDDSTYQAIKKSLPQPVRLITGKNSFQIEFRHLPSGNLGVDRQIWMNEVGEAVLMSQKPVEMLRKDMIFNGNNFGYIAHTIMGGQKILERAVDLIYKWEKDFRSIKIPAIKDQIVKLIRQWNSLVRIYLIELDIHYGIKDTFTARDMCGRFQDCVNAFLFGFRKKIMEVTSEQIPSCLSKIAREDQVERWVTSCLNSNDLFKLFTSAELPMNHQVVTLPDSYPSTLENIMKMIIRKHLEHVIKSSIIDLIGLAICEHESTLTTGKVPPDGSLMWFMIKDQVTTEWSMVTGMVTPWFQNLHKLVQERCGGKVAER